MKHALCCRGFFSFGGRPRVWTFGWCCWRWSGLCESLRKSLFVRRSVVSCPRWSSLQPACTRPPPLPPQTAVVEGPSAQHCSHTDGGTLTLWTRSPCWRRLRSSPSAGSSPAPGRPPSWSPGPPALTRAVPAGSACWPETR